MEEDEGSRVPSCGIDCHTGKHKWRPDQGKVESEMEEEPTVITANTEEAPASTEQYWLKHSRSGGAYVPPQRAALMRQEIPSQETEAFQRLSWEALRKSLNGLINKINIANIKELIVELFGENLIRGRGLLVRSVMKAQSQALPFTSVYAAMMAVINTKLPMIGELLLVRLIHQFRKAYRRNDKSQCLAVTMFLAHLVNQKVAHEIVALQVLTLLLERPTDDSVEIAIGFMRECGAVLSEISPRPTNAIFERFRVILHEGLIDKRVQYMIEVLFQLRKDKFVGHEAIKAELDLVAEDDQITHYVSLDDEVDPQEGLNIFKFDPEYLEKEAKYQEIKTEILGDEADEEEEEAQVFEAPPPESTVAIKDETSTDLINLRKTIYLTVMSSVDFEECGHKLLKLQIPEGYEIELCNMVIECCSQERTYLKFYGLLAERFCQLDPVWQENFERCFNEVYNTVHRLETNKIRNICKLFGHLLYTNVISWAVLGVILLTEEDTTSASRIFIKFLLQELQELFGMPKLKVKLSSPELVQLGYFDGLFPKDSPRNTRFAINFYTAIGLGPLTDDLREHLEAVQAQAVVEEAYAPVEDPYNRAPSPHDSYASSSPSSSRAPPTRERSRSPQRYRSRSRTPPRRDRSRTPPRYRSRTPERYRSRSPRRRSPSPRRDRSRSRDRYRERSRRDDYDRYDRRR